MWGSGGITPPFLISALGGGEWSDLRSGRFTPVERARGNHWIGSWVGPIAGLDAMKRKICFSCRESNPGHPARSLSLYRLFCILVRRFLVCLTVCVPGVFVAVWVINEAVLMNNVGGSTCVIEIISKQGCGCGTAGENRINLSNFLSIRSSCHSPRS
jgi:hypothetical protein